ncbi:hypothetical protein E4U42_002552 [Claviceps africana]|uniref:Uncharacterized protein n=1 Tax=Claviceps africana TaxID=83212 RepID=A0A8K0JAI4_9HYPO|nr:hypothetical protein E4U42_002552 [Claviceps africana]
MIDCLGFRLLYTSVVIALLPRALGFPSQCHPVGIRALPSNSEPQIITGLYGNRTAAAQIVIHDAAGKASWSWSVHDGKNISPDLRACLHDACRAEGCSATENKWANDGDSVVAIYGSAAIIINHHPGRDTDKAVSFGVCLNRDNMQNTHSAEMLPDGKIAIATTSNDVTGNIKIFDIHRSRHVRAAPVQQLDGIAAVHALLWDDQRRVLWAAGNDRSPQAEGSTSILNAYKYAAGSFQAQHESHVITNPTRLSTEWGFGTSWWNGPHAMTPVPHQRRLLITTDLDVHIYDMDTRTFQHGESVAQQYLKGFQPDGVRTGPDGVSLPRSDLKSIGFLENGNALYVQAQWGQVFGKHVNHLSRGNKQPNLWDQILYRSRWFSQTAW